MQCLKSFSRDHFWAKNLFRSIFIEIEKRLAIRSNFQISSEKTSKSIFGLKISEKRARHLLKSKGPKSLVIYLTKDLGSLSLPRIWSNHTLLEKKGSTYINLSYNVPWQINRTEHDSLRFNEVKTNLLKKTSRSRSKSLGTLW